MWRGALVRRGVLVRRGGGAGRAGTGGRVLSRAVLARGLRWLAVAVYVAVVFALVVFGLRGLMAPTGVAVVLPFLAAAVSVAALPPVLRAVDRLLGPLAGDAAATPYAALAEAAARIRGGSLEQALPGLARVLAAGTGARRAELWLAVEDRLVSAARYPPATDPAARSMPNLAVLLAQPDTDHVVPVLDGSVLRAALAIGEPGRPITPADLRLMRDVANGAGLLLRGVALNAELAERVRRADELAAELRASRQRITQARDVERRRLVAELGEVTTGRLAALRADLAAAAEAISDPDPDGTEDPDEDPEERGARAAILRARTGLDELLDRFRAIARGVYPSVLRDHGPLGALDELVADLPRPVDLAGEVPRLPWEIESGIYYLTASAVRALTGPGGARPLRVALAHGQGRLTVEIDDPAPGIPVDELRAALAHDAERLAALGGMLEVADRAPGGLGVRAWLPDELEPSVDLRAVVVTPGTGPSAPGFPAVTGRS
jgi:signal transduction histidine kinase